MLLHLTKEDIQGYCRQTNEYIFLDCIDVEPEIYAESLKTLTTNEWYFPMHFPDNPIMPGVFQMEMIQQTGGLIINTMKGKKRIPLYFYSAKDITIKKAAKPGDVLKARVDLLRYRRGLANFHGKLTVNEELSCEMDFSLISPDEIIGGHVNA